ncbi:uncharacterized protein [Leptinotarsa decemlineata]|uniref:uncharacterized protein n=1 Tax=Leptinotarsa decemlineata TaxID=7539 RepID=UPI003D3079AD
MICVISIIGNMFWNRERWSHYIKIQNILRSKLQVEKLWRRMIYFVSEIIIGHIIILIAVFLDQYRNFISDGTPKDKFIQIITTAIKDILYYYIFLNTIVIYNTVLLLRKDFIVLKDFLTSSLNIQEIELFPIQKPVESVTSSVPITKDETLKKLLEASRILNILFECVEICNGIFGVVILLMNFSTVLVILSCLNRLLIEGEMNHLTAEIVAYNTSEFLIFLVLNSIVTSACGLLNQESTSVINHCCKLQHLVPQSSKERQELLNLARQVSGKDSKISAAGFFNVDFSLIFLVFNYVATYIVVLIQLSYIDF